MADALCGPSNPLQNLQKHASVDRTLQQDRVVSSSSPGQAFRSPNPAEGALDTEFAAFEAGLSADAAFAPPPGQIADPFFASHLHSPAPPLFHQHAPHAGPVDAGPAGWASDFAQLHLSEPPQALHGLSGPVQKQPATSGWFQEFTHQQQQQQQQGPMMQPAMQHMPAFGSALGGMAYPAMNGFAMQPNMPLNMQPAQASGETAEMDESAFEEAFAKAREEVESQEKEAPEELEKKTNAAEPVENIRIGSDLVKPSSDGRTEPDALARTAGELLDNVKHESSQKFKESSFLGLMRQLRDREVTVDGDRFREIQQPLHPGGEFYPERRRADLQGTTQESNIRGKEKEKEDIATDADTMRTPEALERGYGGNFDSSVSLGDDNILYDGLPWEGRPHYEVY